MRHPNNFPIIFGKFLLLFPELLVTQGIYKQGEIELL